jgi:rhodanese-related sulfurtransferase
MNGDFLWKDCIMAVRSISARELHQMVAAGKTIDLVDVRTQREFNNVHATPAQLVPLDTLDAAKFLSTRNGRSKEPIYVICHSGMRSANACAKFIAAGFDNVYNVEGGTSAWVKAGLPVVRGKSAMSVERQTRLVMGLMVLTGVVLGFQVHPGFFGLSAFVGLGLVMAGLTDFCPLALLIARMRWNKSGESACCCKA